MSEVFENGLDNVFRLEEFKRKGIQLVNNTPDDILDLFSEINQNCKPEESSSQIREDNYLEKSFGKYSKAVHKLIIYLK